ncbi:phage integrase N-terminal SAM-like domain-containing protein, partial [Escherichia coli]|uniref:phage integrase N-terminal SAM-like domain-containing protein n=1 Tax=Escherichia coli TaxID=562 RepID=UPI001F310EDB
MKTATAPLPPLRSVKVLDQLRERIRYLHYSLRTEQAYVHWVRAFIRFHGVRHPATLGSSEVEGHCCKVSDEAAFCLIQRPYISKTLLTRRISPRG